MSNIKSRFLKGLVIFQQLFSIKKMSSSATADIKTLEDFGYKFNSDGGLASQMTFLSYSIIL